MAEKATAERIILGIDPGTNVMGFAVLRCPLLQTRKGAVVPLTIGALKMKKTESHYLRLKQIRDKVMELISEYLPDEMAIESPYFGINVTSVVKLCRAQGAAMTAALDRDIPIHEYPPARVKIAITGNGRASKEQVSAMVRSILHFEENQDVPLDATDALAIALCHYYETSKGLPDGAFGHGAKKSRSKGGSAGSSWEKFVEANKNRVHKQ